MTGDKQDICREWHIQQPTIVSFPEHIISGGCGLGTRLPHNLANPVPISLLWTLKLASSICMNCVQMYYPWCSENKTSSVLFFHEATFMQGMYHPQQSSRRFQSFPRASQLIWPTATHCGDEGGLRKTPAKREKHEHIQQNSKPGDKANLRARWLPCDRSCGGLRGACDSPSGSLPEPWTSHTTCREV